MPQNARSAADKVTMFEFVPALEMLAHQKPVVVREIL